MYTSKKQALIALKKSKSVLEKTLSMLESDMGCSDIIVQNMAAIGLIKSANNKLIEAFLETQYDESLNKKRKLLEIFKLSHK